MARLRDTSGGVVHSAASQAVCSGLATSREENVRALKSTCSEFPERDSCKKILSAACLRPVSEACRCPKPTRTWVEGQRSAAPTPVCQGGWAPSSGTYFSNCHSLCVPNSWETTPFLITEAGDGPGRPVNLTLFFLFCFILSFGHGYAVKTSHSARSLLELVSEREEDRQTGEAMTSLSQEGPLWLLRSHLHLRGLRN